MKLNRALSLLALALATVPLTAAPIVFRTDLSGPAESPPNASPGTGFAFVTIDPALHTMRVVVDFSGLLGLTTASHIHIINGPGDLNTADTLGPVATTTPTFPGFPSGVSAGSYDRTFDMTQAVSYRAGFLNDSGGIDAAEAALFNGIMSGRAYLNVHSSLYTGGEIRGFLEPVPEPATLGFAAAALVGIALLRRRIRA